MAMNSTTTSPDVSNIHISDIYGLWEVVRITRRVDNKPIYPWLYGRYKFNFLDEKIYMCMKNWKQSHGNWELIEKAFETKKRYSIVLNGTYEYAITDFNVDEMTFIDQSSEYLLIRRL